MKDKNKIIIGVIIGIVILGIVGNLLPNKKTENIEDNKIEKEEEQEIFHQDKDINRFILDYNKTNPNNAFTKEEVSSSSVWA